MTHKEFSGKDDISLLLNSWHSLQDRFRRVGGAWLIDTKGFILAGSDVISSRCVQMQETQMGRQRCAECYKNLCFANIDGKINCISFTCHAGLTNIALQLVVRERILGAIIAGGIPSANNIGQPDVNKNPVFQLQKIVEAEAPTIQFFLETLEKQLKSLRVRHAVAAQTRWNQMMRDDLTGLGNKKYLLFRLRQELPLSNRRHYPTCLLSLRLENLNATNQEFGHACGDNALKKFAEVLNETVRETDVAVRYEGNIFALLLPRSTQQQAVELANRLSAKVESAKFLINLKLKMGLINCSLSHHQPEALDCSIRQALEQANINAHFLGILPVAFPAILKRPKRRVVITGVGIVSPLGCDKETFRQAIYEGRSGIRRLTLFDPEEFPSQIGGEVQGFEPLRFIDKKKLALLGRASSFAVVAAKMAVLDAKVDLEAEDSNRIGVCIGSAIAGLEFGEAQIFNFMKFGAEEISPYLSIIVFGGAISSETSMALNVKGRSTTLSTGCAAGTDAMGEAFHQIRSNKADIVLGGGVDAPIRQVIFGSFCTIEALSTRYNTCPERASRPFDRGRDGFVIAEGAGILIFEELQHALRRGAHIYGEVLGFGSTNDAYHMSQPAPDTRAATEAVRLALKDAGIEPKHIDYINVHGSSTPLNDRTETKVIKTVFGKHAYRLAISSTKSMLGHPIGASGALELIASLLSMEKGFIPPTINYENPDPDCDLDCVPNKARTCPTNIILSNSLGFGGKNASIIVGRY